MKLLAKLTSTTKSAYKDQWRMEKIMDCVSLNQYPTFDPPINSKVLKFQPNHEFNNDKWNFWWNRKPNYFNPLATLLTSSTHESITFANMDHINQKRAFIRWPGLTAITVWLHLPRSKATIKAHAKQPPQTFYQQQNWPCKENHIRSINSESDKLDTANTKFCLTVILDD